jgi:hypothetical protein
MRIGARAHVGVRTGAGNGARSGVRIGAGCNGHGF